MRRETTSVSPKRKVRPSNRSKFAYAPHDSIDCADKIDVDLAFPHRHCVVAHTAKCTAMAEISLCVFLELRHPVVFVSFRQDTATTAHVLVPKAAIDEEAQHVGKNEIWLPWEAPDVLKGPEPPLTQQFVNAHLGERTLAANAAHVLGASHSVQQSRRERDEMSKLRDDRLKEGLCPECGRESRGTTTKLGANCLARKAEASRRSRRAKSKPSV